MPRSSRHQRSDSVERAVQVFWERGYHATSLKDLERALDMRPGSIYAAFGSKAGLFRMALERYSATMGADVARVMSRAASPVTGLREYLKEVARACTGAHAEGDWPIPGCMLVKTILEVGNDEPEIRGSAEAVLAEVESALTRMLSKARAMGELRSDVEPARLARLLQAQIMGLRSFAQRETVSAEHVRDLAEDMGAILDPYLARKSHRSAST